MIAHGDHSVSVARYAGALPNTDLVCELRGDGLKETLVLKGPGELEGPKTPDQFRFVLDAGSLAWEETGDGGLRLWDAADPGADVFRIPAPYMVAALGLEPLLLERPGAEETSYAEYVKPCKAGEHTFSVYVRSRGDTLAWAEIAWRDGEGQWHAVESEKVRRVGASLRLTCTIDLPQAATVRCRALAGEGGGSAWFDQAQLERGALANRHNLLQR